MTAANRALVERFYSALWSPATACALAEHLADGFVEHLYAAGFSRAGLADYVTRRRNAYPDHAVTIHHCLSDGDLVFLFVEEHLADGIDYARAELFRIADGRIAEHWGGQVLDDKNRKNPNDTWRGSHVDRGTDHGARFGAAFEALDARGFDGQELETFAQSRTPDYRQHSPKGGDGRSGLVEILAKAKAAGIKVTMRRYRTIADGDFLVSHRLYDTSPPHPLMTRIYTFDMFRLNAAGQATEHWDVMDEVPDPDLLERMA
jgi:predicted SnoaL-like aldol condensation-catalyzing enzyme